jgi:hypothetical protein
MIAIVLPRPLRRVVWRTEVTTADTVPGVAFGVRRSSASCRELGGVMLLECCRVLFRKEFSRMTSVVPSGPEVVGYVKSFRNETGAIGTLSLFEGFRH